MLLGRKDGKDSAFRKKHNTAIADYIAHTRYSIRFLTVGKG